jgi:hypothetical protein
MKSDAIVKTPAHDVLVKAGPGGCRRDIRDTQGSGHISGLSHVILAHIEQARNRPASPDAPDCANKFSRGFGEIEPLDQRKARHIRKRVFAVRVHEHCQRQTPFLKGLILAPTHHTHKQDDSGLHCDTP